MISDKPKSAIPKKIEMAMVSPKTIYVDLNVASRVGHWTRLNSERTSSKNCLILLNITDFIFFLAKALRKFQKFQGWQARQESNLRPSVLETDALPS